MVVGKTTPATLKKLKEASGKIRAEGECRLVGDELRLKDDSGKLDPPKMTNLKRVLNEMKISFKPTLVESFEGGAGARAHAIVLAETKKKLILFATRVAVISNKGGEAKTDADKVEAQLNKLRQAIAKGADAPQTGKRLEEICDAVAKNVAGLEKKHAGRRVITDEEVATSQKQEQAEELTRLRNMTAVSDRAQEATQTAVEHILAARKRALDWQKREMKAFTDNHAAFDRLQTKFRADENTMETSLQTAKTALEQARSSYAAAEKLWREETGKNAKKRLHAKLPPLQKKIREAERALATVEEQLKTLRKEFSEARALVSAGDKHGTSRHGAHTGLEQQARRAATDGKSADQDGNEWGDSTEKPQPEESSVAPSGSDKQRIKFGAEEFEIEWNTDADGKRTIVDEAAVMSRLEEIADGLESRGAKTSTSSNFLSPELEQEAAERAIKVAKQCVWDEMWDDGKSAWLPIDRFFVYVGPPRKVRSKGWGHSVRRKKDSDGNSVAKMKILQANNILNAFRNVKIDANKMMKALKVEMVASDDGGAILQPVARVMIDKLGSGWTNTSQYPTEDTPGWSLKGKKVRKSRDGGDGEVAPDATGV